MERNKKSAIAMIALILGAAGLGIGAYSVISLQTGAAKGDDGDDGDDGSSGITTVEYKTDHEYPCSSQSEIEDALDTIGTGHGTIVITENITLSSEININDGGNYIIRGEGLVTLDRNADDETFNITNAQSLILKDLIINTSSIITESTPGILVHEKNDNPVHIENIQIGGGAGRGFYINSENVWLEDCIISDLCCGIYLDSDCEFSHILDNSLLDINSDTENAYGIYSYYSNNNTFSGNTVNKITSSGHNAYGIYLYFSDSNILTGNTVNSISSVFVACGIYLFYSDSNSLSGNIVNSISSASSSALGISIIFSLCNTLSGNSFNTISSSAGSAYGIRLQFSSDSNTLIGNSFNTISGNVTSYGILCGIIFDDSKFNTVADNTIDGIYSTNGKAYGIYLDSSPYNTLTGNIVRGITSSNNYAWGLYLSYSDCNTLTGNTVNSISSVSSSAMGIYLYYSDYNTLTGNIISNIQASTTGYAIRGVTSAYNVIIGNNIYLCDIGIDFPGATNEIDHNITA